MKFIAIIFPAILVLSGPPAVSQVRMGIEIGLPSALSWVVVAPGIQVVEGFQDEVFLQGGWYWCRRPDGWYRSRNPRAHFDYVERRRVPSRLNQVPVGRYQNWHRERPGRGPERGHGRGMEPGHPGGHGRPGDREPRHEH